MNKIRYSEITSEIARQAWQLYTTSFPQEEQRSYALFQKALGDSHFCPYVYISEQSELLAICFYWDFSNFIYLEHFAVNTNCRNRGVGSKIIKTFSDSNKSVILEIEPPIDAQQKQRLRFYKRNCFIPTGYDFKQLKYTKNSDDLFLDLLCNKQMDAELFQQFKNTIYRELSRYCE